VNCQMTDLNTALGSGKLLQAMLSRGTPAAGDLKLSHLLHNNLPASQRSTQEGSLVISGYSRTV